MSNIAFFITGFEMPIRNAAQRGMDHKNGGVISSTPDIRTSRENQSCALPAFPIEQVTNNDFAFPDSAATDAKHNQPYWQ